MDKEKLKSTLKSIGNIVGDIGIPIVSSVASMATNILGSKIQKETVNNEMSGAEMQAFNLNAQEAQKARDWNAEQDNTKYQRQVADMQAAGVNPALAMNGGVSTQAGSNAMANASTTAVSPMNSVTDFATQVATLKNMRAQEEKTREEAHAVRIQNTVNEVTALKKALADLAVSNATAEEKQTQAKALEAEIKVKESVLKLNDKQYTIYEKTIEKMGIENSNLDNAMKADIALKMAEANLKDADLEAFDWNNAKMMTLSEARNASGSFGLNFIGQGGNGSLGEGESKTTMGYLIFNRKEKTYTFVAADSYLSVNFNSPRDRGEGGSTSTYGGNGHSGGNAYGDTHGSGGR